MVTAKAMAEFVDAARAAAIPINYGV
jgi:hypothetical protein